MIKVDIESSQFEVKQKKNGQGTYAVQEAFAHTFNRNGEPNRYPEKFNIFLSTDTQGNPMPYQPGTYTLAQNCLRINNGFLELAFPQLVPVNQKKTG